ncbi:hypothetical protein [Bacillus sp. NSP9.1]|uniref:hypothetical protein n=1 Tax=Bacillus sp. NSP9.1 TaxID=1071078 RepID=UPI001F172B05|nr:hypothetical protein [Bacillus sp. NSP9.1]
MSNVKAISGATGDEFEALKNIAAKMGAETKFTAVEAAEGLQFLAKQSCLPIGFISLTFLRLWRWTKSVKVCFCTP